MTDVELALFVAETVVYAADEDVDARQRGIDMLFGLRMGLRAIGPVHHKWHREVGAWEELLASDTSNKDVQAAGYAIIRLLRENEYLSHPCGPLGESIITNETKLEGYNV